jgi:hypothetical protein
VVDTSHLEEYHPGQVAARRSGNDGWQKPRFRLTEKLSEPENQSNLEMNARWNHFVFPVISTAKRAFIFNLSGTSEP